MITSKYIIGRVKQLRLVLALTLFFMPLFLILITNEIRPSISNYAYSEFPYLLPIFLTIGFMAFVVDAVISRSRNYNLFIGSMLLGIAFTPHLNYPILHYSFAGLFFLSSIISMYRTIARKKKIYIIALTTIILIAVLGSFQFHWFSVFLAEWFGIIPITITFIGLKYK